MKITRIYSDKNGETHFGEIDIALNPRGDIGSLSEKLPATGIMFREVPATYDYDWHNAPRRQYIINLDAGVEITVSDGETRRLEAGAVFLVEDTTGKGHISRAINGQVRHCIFVTLD